MTTPGCPRAQLEDSDGVGLEVVVVVVVLFREPLPANESAGIKG